MPPKIILNSEYCHTTNGLPTAVPLDQLQQPWMVPLDHAQLPHLVQGGPSTARSIITVRPPSHGQSPTARPFTGMAASVANYT